MYEFKELYQTLSRNFIRALIKHAARHLLRQVKFYGIRGFCPHYGKFFTRKSFVVFVLDIVKTARQMGKVGQKNQITF